MMEFKIVDLQRIMVIFPLVIVFIIATVMADLNKALLKCHNELRRRHKALDLVQCNILTKEAEDWADHLARMDRLDHSDTIFGENLHTMTMSETHASTEYIALLACRQWYKEIETYDFVNPSHSVNTANFTQMIWRNTEHMGAAISISETGNVYVVALYFPPGNSAQQFVYSRRK